MTTDLAHRKDLILRARDFERQCKVAGLFGILRQWGVMQYGPATPSPEQDLVTIEKLSVFGRYRVLSGDQIKLRKSREVPLYRDVDIDTGSGYANHYANSPLDRQIHAEWLADTFD
jgi:hypothetical protein